MSVGCGSRRKGASSLRNGEINKSRKEIVMGTEGTTEWSRQALTSIIPCARHILEKSTNIESLMWRIRLLSDASSRDVRGVCGHMCADDFV